VSVSGRAPNTLAITHCEMMSECQWACTKHFGCSFLVVLGIAIAKQLYGKSKKPTNENEEFVTQYVC